MCVSVAVVRSGTPAAFQPTQKTRRSRSPTLASQYSIDASRRGQGRGAAAATRRRQLYATVRARRRGTPRSATSREPYPISPLQRVDLRALPRRDHAHHDPLRRGGVARLADVPGPQRQGANTAKQRHPLPGRRRRSTRPSDAGGSASSGPGGLRARHAPDARRRRGVASCPAPRRAPISDPPGRSRRRARPRRRRADDRALARPARGRAGRAPAHPGPPRGCSPSPASRATTSATTRRTAFDELYAAHRRRPGRAGRVVARRARSSTPCPGRRSSPSGPSSSCARAATSTSSASRPSRSSTSPARRWGSTRWPRACASPTPSTASSRCAVPARCWCSRPTRPRCSPRVADALPPGADVTVLHHLGLADERSSRRASRASPVRGRRPPHEPLGAGAAPRRCGSGRVARRARAPAARRVPVGRRADPRVADAPPARGVLRGARRARAPSAREGDGARGRRGVVDHADEELGDLLFQSSSTPSSGPRRGSSTSPRSPTRVRDKLVSRHPHVFGDAEARTAREVAARWEVLKRDEKGRGSALDGVAFALPALALYAKLLHRAERRRARRARARATRRGRDRARSTRWSTSALARSTPGSTSRASCASAR